MTTLQQYAGLWWEYSTTMNRARKFFQENNDWATPSFEYANAKVIPIKDGPFDYKGDLVRPPEPTDPLYEFSIAEYQMAKEGGWIHTQEGNWQKPS